MPLGCQWQHKCPLWVVLTLHFNTNPCLHKRVRTAIANDDPTDWRRVPERAGVKWSGFGGAHGGVRAKAKAPSQPPILAASPRPRAPAVGRDTGHSNDTS